MLLTNKLAQFEFFLNFDMFYDILSQFLCAKFSVRKLACAKNYIFLEGLMSLPTMCQMSGVHCQVLLNFIFFLLFIIFFTDKVVGLKSLGRRPNSSAGARSKPTQRAVPSSVCYRTLRPCKFPKRVNPERKQITAVLLSFFYSLSGNVAAQKIFYCIF